MSDVACHVAYEVHEASQVGEVRRAAIRLAQDHGFDDVAAGRVALVATELGTNLVRHASQGRLLLGMVDSQGVPMIELLSLDQGPGIVNVAACMADGYSTGGTPGSGLGAVRRLSNEFDLFSDVPTGTVIMARLAAQSASRTVRVADESAEVFAVGAIALAAPGEFVCGDAWAVVQQGPLASAIVADGLGHGPLAREASAAAIALFQAHALGSPGHVVERMHEPLRATRGAAILMLKLDAAAHKLTFSGAGNVVGRLISGVDDRSLATQHGTVGVQIRRLQDIQYDWPAHALVVLHSDGLTTRWHLDKVKGILQHHPSVIAGWLMRDNCRGRDDATVVVLKRRNG
ncbi:MAG: ATP-binding protein/SpoIIE family protein phosphatase [Aquabacterium sp.]